MSERSRLIRSRAESLFRRENAVPLLSLESIPHSGLASWRIPVAENVRKTYFKRAEEELITEGRIERPPLAD